MGIVHMKVIPYNIWVLPCAQAILKGVAPFLDIVNEVQPLLASEKKRILELFD